MAAVTKHYKLIPGWVQEGDHVIRQHADIVRLAKGAQRRIMATRPRIILTYILRTLYEQREDIIAAQTHRSRTSVIRMLNTAEYDMENDPTFNADLKAIRRML